MQFERILAKPPVDALEIIQRILDARALSHHLLRLLLIVPEIRVFRRRVQFDELLFQ